MSKVSILIRRIAAAEAELATFVAPCVRGGAIRARVNGLVKTFRPEPRRFEGWGVFRPISEKKAKVEEEASFPAVASYLRLLPMLRMILIRPLARASWLAYPANESDARQRFGTAEPVRVHLVDGGAPLEPILARFDGTSWWFEDLDRRADPTLAPALRHRLTERVSEERLRLRGLTPELRTAYGLAIERTEQAKRAASEASGGGCEGFARAGPAGQAKRAASEASGGGCEGFARAGPAGQAKRHRLMDALETAGGTLCDFSEHGDHWVVEWQTKDGERHTSAIEKDLSVRSAGICLSGRERSFDLESLVGVMEGRDG